MPKDWNCYSDLLHNGTNDLTASSPLNDFIYDLTTLITQASTNFPQFP